jgi:hypothetical protein
MLRSACFLTGNIVILKMINNICVMYSILALRLTPALVPAKVAAAQLQQNSERKEFLEEDLVRLKVRRACLFVAERWGCGVTLGLSNGLPTYGYLFIRISVCLRCVVEGGQVGPLDSDASELSETQGGVPLEDNASEMYLSVLISDCRYRVEKLVGRFAGFHSASVIIDDILGRDRQDLLLQRLQQPSSGAYLCVESGGQGDFVALLRHAATDGARLAEAEGSLRWLEDFNEPYSVWCVGRPFNFTRTTHQALRRAFVNIISIHR